MGRWTQDTEDTVGIRIHETWRRAASQSFGQAVKRTTLCKRSAT